MNTFLRLFSLFLFFISSINSQAQNCQLKVSGYVLNSKDKTPLTGASVSISSSGTTVLTDSNGYFALSNLCQGNYDIHVSNVGFAEKHIVFTLGANKELQVVLNPKTTTLKSVEVRGTKTEARPLQTTSQLTGTALEMTKGVSLGEALKAIAGVNSIQTGPNISKPIIQGLYGNRVLVYNAGVRQEGQQWGSEHAPEVDPFIASQLTVIKGAASVMYGADAIGGVVLVEPAPLGYRSGLGGNLHLVGMSNSGLGAFSGSLEGSSGKNNEFSWRAQGTGRIAGNSKTANYYLKNTGLREYNGALTLGYRKNSFSAELYASSFNTKLGIFSGSNVGSTEDRDNAIGRNEPLDIYKSDLNYTIERPYQEVNHHIAKIKGSYRFEDVGTISVQYSYQQNFRKEFDVVRGSSEDTYQYRFDLSTQVADISFEHKKLLGMVGKIGVNAIYQQNFYDGAYLIPFFNSLNGAAYFIERYSSGNLSLEAGFRYDHKNMDVTKRVNPRDSNSPFEYPEFRFSQVSGTVGASYQLPHAFKLTSTIAKGWRPPAINELFIEGVHQGNASFERGDRSLKEESSISLSAGLVRQTGKLTGEFNVYRNLIDNYIYLQPQLDAQGKPIFEITQRGGFLSNKFVQLDARFTGADLSLAYELNRHFTFLGKYAMVRAYDKKSGDHLIYIPADKVSGTLSYHLLETKGLGKTTFELSATHVSKQSRVRDNQDFAPAPSAYTLLDADISSTLKVRGNEWNISLSVNNALNTEYRDYLNRFRYYSADLGRNITLRLKIPFGNNKNSNN
ncbi:TonB-dependent receptor [Pedobacter lithocola]|uniref:TonB-dependent receptor n=1 Tax=Pedobacter lithocola TaxID=1908239 RepID=A0ABV8PHC1_9SPHI